MFYSQLVLAKKGPLGKIWLAAHMEKKVPKLSIIETNIPESVENIETVPMALRVSGHLLLGVVRIFSRKVTYLLTDCSEALVKIKDAFRAPGGVELAPGAGTKSYEEITRHDQLDEMDLDADLADQQMLFTIEDGIELPDGLDGIELPDPEHDDLAAIFPDQETGFQADEKLECLPDFFPEAKRDGRFPTEEDEDEEEALEAEGLGHASKRRRSSAAQAENDEDDDDEVVPERLRSHAVELAGGVDTLPQGDELFSEAFDDSFQPHEEEMEEEEGLDHALPNEPEEPEAEDEDEDEDGLDKVMDKRSQRDKEAPAPSPKGQGGAEAQAKKGGKPRPKRKMIFDTETQLSAEFLRKQLDDPSAIVRDFKAEAAANMAKAGKARRMFTSKQNQYDPIVDAPRLFYLPTDIGTMSCFLPKNQMPSPKRMRIAREEGKRAEEDEEGEDRPEVTRRSTGGQPDGGFAALAKDLEDNEVPHGMELEDAEEMGQGHGAGSFVEEEPNDEPLPFEDDEPFGEEEPADASVEEDEQATGFNPSLELPNVNFDSTEDADPSQQAAGSQGAPQGSHDPAAWNPRTRKMYGVLQSAFDKSDDAPLSYDAMIKRTRKSADKRKVVAGCFQELLFLTTHGMIELDQKKAYGNILVSKTELFGKAVAA